LGLQGPTRFNSINPSEVEGTSGGKVTGRHARSERSTGGVRRKREQVILGSTREGWGNGFNFLRSKREAKRPLLESKNKQQVELRGCDVWPAY